MASHNYDDVFFDYIEIGSRSSAKAIISLLMQELNITSVLDVGCGRGVWLDEWLKHGISDILGIDGTYVDVNSLEIPAHLFQAANLANQLHLERKFDLVQSLEVAEHIPEQFADTFVENLVIHGDMILFSAAPPGQGGEFHVNEQEYSYWHQKFIRHNYHLIDFVRLQVLKRSDVEPWYRYNTMFFVHASKLQDLSVSLHAFLKAPSETVRDYAPLAWKLRRAILSRLPNVIVSKMAVIKHSIILRLNQIKNASQRFLSI